MTTSRSTIAPPARPAFSDFRAAFGEARPGTAVPLDRLGLAGTDFLGAFSQDIGGGVFADGLLSIASVREEGVLLGPFERVVPVGSRLFASSGLGDLFVLSPRGRVIVLRTDAAEALELAEPPEDFFGLLVERREQLLRASSFVQHSLPLEDRQVLSGDQNQAPLELPEHLARAQRKLGLEVRRSSAPPPLDDPADAYDSALKLIALGQLPEAISLLRVAADHGLPRAAARLGEILFWSPDEDAAEGVRWLKLAAEAGEWRAMYVLGLAHYRGRGVTQADPEEAKRHHEIAALHGVSDAQFEMSLFLYKGIGGPIDVERAREFERKAAEVGHPRACLNLGSWAETGRFGAIDMAEAIRWYERAADAGSPSGAERLALIYETGEGGVPINPGAAAIWRERIKSLG